MASLLADVLEGQGFVVMTASNVLGAKAVLNDFDPDAVLLDIALGEGPTGLDLAHALHVRRPDIAIIFLTRHPDRRTAGLDSADVPPNSGFLRKDLVTDTAYLLNAIEAVLSDRPREVRHDLAAERPLAGLTATQVDVLRMASLGLTNAAIARRRNTSERAVELLLQAIFRTLGIEADGDVNPRVEAVRRYIAVAGMPVK